MRKFELVNDKAVMPKRATEFSAGYDLCVINDKPKTIRPGETYIFDTGVKVYMEKDDVFQIYIRSSVGIKRNLILSNCVPIIDADYPDTIKLAISNVGQFAQIVDTNERIAQGIFTKYLVTDDELAGEAAKPKKKRKGGIGSTNESTAPAA